MFHVILKHDDQTFGLLSDVPGELAVDIFNRYQDEDCSRREGVTHCWVASRNDFQCVVGRPSVDWTPDTPMRENRGCKNTAARVPYDWRAT
jgi:hypothetical protein